MSHRSTFSAAPRLPRLLGTWLLAAALALPGCGGGDTPPDSGPPPVVVAPVGDPVTQTVGTAGGTMRATASGMAVTLTIPDGALPTNTVLTLTPQAPAVGEVASVKLSPGGLFFAKPITVVLQYPSGTLPLATASLRQRLGSDDSYLVTTVDAATRTLSARLTTFGGSGMDVLAHPAALAPAGRAQALRAQPMAEPAAPSDGSLTATNTTPMADIIASIRRQSTILEIVGDFDAAFALQASVGSLLNRRGDPDFAATATLFLRESHDTACLALVAALSETRTATITKATDFAPLRKKAGQWWLIAEQMDLDHVGCAYASIDDFTQAALDLTQRELAFHKGKFSAANLPSLVAEPAAGVKASRRSKLEIEALEAAAATLDLPPLLPQGSDHKTASAHKRPLAVHSTGLASIIQTELLDPLVTPAREAAWTVAKAGQSLAQYPTVMDAFGSVPALAQDAQFVRTRIEVRVNNAGGETLGHSVLGFDTVPDKPADPKRTDTLTVNKSGTLAISGNIANLECASAGTETLKVTFDDTEVATVSAGGGNLLAGALSTLTPPGLLQSAGLSPDDKGSHTLRVRRSVSPCAATLGITDDLLATVTLSFNERRIYFSANPGGYRYGSGIVSIAADGTGYAVHTDNPPVEQCVPDGSSTICGPAQSATDDSPALSPDGTRLLFSRPDALGTPDGIMLARANGSGVTELSNAQGRDIDTAPSWSPDGLRYAYVRMAYLNNAYRPALFVRDIGGSAAVSLASFQDGSLNGTAWSPDGKTIAYARRSASGSGGIYLVAADGSSAASLLVSDSRAQLTPSAWSPDGAKIAFGGDGGIQVVHADGTGLVTLLATSPWPPAWSPDGNDIAFCGGGIRLMKADGSNVRQLWTGNANCDLSWR
ncbi:MAG: PD40 domain-containing protein [Vitreoscilla sp.]|nr:PD40 domain-containing protein [Burkholderiales bacterium]MBP6336300.1 PD40 domain-containing protein [Vitreoscilla sp.]MBP6675109.1 PD40 domain-containing protein [Vitreoscilla sp.]